jgi:molybdopterin/thiamine biosynthesis adenylyltransferase/nitroreductase
VSVGAVNEAADGEGYRPLVFRAGDPAERQGWERLRRSLGDRLRVHDTLSDQIVALIRCRHPKTAFTQRALDDELARHRHGRPAEEVGVWVYYPWRGSAVRLLDEDEFVEVRTSRNRHKITDGEQRQLRQKAVGIVGLSVGGQIAATMALERTCGELRLADFDTLELSNLNRLREGLFSLGANKAVLAARGIAEIDPFLKVVCYEDGLTPANLDSFLTAGRRIDVLVEECDGLEMKLACRLRARELRIPVVMEANDRATLDIERFDREPDRPILHGMLAGHDLSRVGELKTNEEKVPIIMSMVGESTMSDKLRASLIEVGDSIESWPQLAADVAVGAGLVTSTVRRILLGELRESGRYFVDLEQLVADPASEAEGAAAGDRQPGGPSPAQAPSEAEDPGEPGEVTPEPATLDELLMAASLAPSGGNEQPWRWVAAGPRLSARIDGRFGDVLLNFGETARLLALGAAAENIVLLAHAIGLRAKLTLARELSRGSLVQIKFFAPTATAENLERRIPGSDALAAQIPRRHTNRRLVPPTPLPAGAIAELHDAVASLPGCRLQVVEDAAGRAELADIAARAERLRMLHPAGHRDLVREIRWTPEDARRARDGIDLDTLELGAAERAGLRMLREPGVARLLRRWRRGRALEKLGRRAIVAASAVGLVSAPDSSVAARLTAGRAIQRVWLTATRLGIGVQPHTSPLYLFARAFGGGAADFAPEELDELSELKTRFDAVVASRPLPVFMFRLFPGCEPSARSLRLPVGAILTSHERRQYLPT